MTREEFLQECRDFVAYAGSDAFNESFAAYESISTELAEHNEKLAHHLTECVQHMRHALMWAKFTLDTESQKSS